MTLNLKKNNRCHNYTFQICGSHLRFEEKWVEFMKGNGKVKCKVLPRTGHKGHEGE
jgi:hypothetical protein